jgi:pSer/pThr/pTyr-binding forkhead associated (FHA) protein
VTIVEPDTAIGRARGNALVLPDVSVSRRHAVVRREGDSWFVVDLDSANGTRVGGRRARRARLGDGVELALGDSVVRFVDPRQARTLSGFRGRSAAVAATIVASVLAVAVWPARDAPGAAGLPGTAAGLGTARGESGSQDRHGAEDSPDRDGAADGEVTPRDAPRKQASSGETHASETSPATRADRATSATKPRGELRGNEVVRAYRTGDVARAIDLCAACRMLRDLQAFEAARRDGAAHAAAGETSEAIAAFGRAESLDRSICSERRGDSVPGRQVRRALSVLHERAAARDGDAEERLAAAAAHLRAAIAFDGANASARNRLDEVTAVARGMYFRAYVAKDSDPDDARRAFRIVAAVLPLDDELGRKARRRLEQLDRGRR